MSLFAGYRYYSYLLLLLLLLHLQLLLLINHNHSERLMKVCFQRSLAIFTPPDNYIFRTHYSEFYLFIYYLIGKYSQGIQQFPR